MSSASADPALAIHPDGNTGVPNWKMGMWLFLASEVMFFTGLIGGYIVLRLGYDNWPAPDTILKINILGVNTFILIVSSVTYVLALDAIQHGKRGKMILLLLATAALGTTFLCIKAYDYTHMIHEHHGPSTSLFSSCYFTLTGFHGLHVFGGVVSILCLVVAGLRGAFSPESHAYVENVGLYWHFVDLVWIILFAILCLV